MRLTPRPIRREGRGRRGGRGGPRPKMFRILAGMDQKDRCSGIYKTGFPGYNTPRAVLSFLVRWLMKLCIMARMVQKDSCSSMARLVLLVTVHLALCFLPCLQARDARHHGRYGPEGFVRHVQGLVCWVLTMSLALCSSWLSQAQDVRHHGRHGPQDSVEVHRCSSWARSFTCCWSAMSGVMVQTVQKTVWRFHRCSSSSRSSSSPSWRRGWNTFYVPLFLTVTCPVFVLPEVYRSMDSSGR